MAPFHAVFEAVTPGLNHIRWPVADFSRVPYAVFFDRAVYEAEQQRLFRGPFWNYLGLEAEIPNPGDYLLSVVGETPVIVVRDDDGGVNAMVNSCAHRGALVARRNHGHAKDFTCAYHQWCYNLKGRLMGVPQRRGVRGKGGMPADFDMANHRLEPLRVEIYKGIIFGTFSPQTVPLVEYLGPEICHQLDRIFDRKPRLLGYYRQRVPANWKLYLENVKDPYHAGLLHLFHVTFGIYRPTMVGGAKVTPDSGHSYLISASSEDETKQLKDLYQGIDKLREGYRLNDPSILQVDYDYPDRVQNMILTVFPNVMIGQVANTFQTRHVRPKGTDLFELYWTYFAFEDDSEKKVADKIMQTNFIGPAGYISMEDGEAGRLVQRGIRGQGHRCSVVEMGGRGPIESTDHLATEVAIRGFWAHYHRVMGFAPPADTGESQSQGRRPS